MVSIIVTCYNQEDFIAKALNSVLKQTYPNWECLIIDDGSTDKSKTIVQAFEEKDARFKYVYQKNQGVTAARNYGFKLAQGNFIQFLDGDDWLSEQKLEKHLRYLESNLNIDIVYSPYTHFYDESAKMESYSYRNITENPLHEFLFFWDRGVSITPHAPLFRKSVWLENEIPFATDYHDRYEDWVFWITIALKPVKFGFLEDALVYYRIHESNFCSSFQDVSLNRLNAASYIKQIIPQELRDTFWKETVSFVLENYHVEKRSEVLLDNFVISLNRKKFNWLKKLVSPFRLTKKL